jgi:hypothetical protein
MSSATPALAVLNDLPPIAELPLPINVTALPMNVIAPPISVTAPLINIAALLINVTEALQARLNHTLDGLAIGLKSAQPIAIAITPPRTQTPTPLIP